jgi:hypothetical protein
MDITLAIKALREARGPFTSVEDLAASLRLDPNTVIRIGEYTVCPPIPTHRPRRTSVSFLVDVRPDQCG